MALDNSDNQDYTQLLMSFIKNELADEEKLTLIKAVNEHKELSDELIEIQNTWTLLNQYEAPEPSIRMDEKFQNMFSSYQSERKGFSFSKVGLAVSNLVNQMWPTHKAAQMTMVSLLMLIVFFGGYWLSSGQNYREQISRQNTEIKELQANMMLTLLSQKSPIERLKAVSISQDLKEIDTKITEALLNTLNHDDNDNVRLASLEALIAFADNADVRMGLIASIGNQDSPLLQMALAEVMVKLQEKRSVEALREVLKNENTPEEIKVKIRESINVLI